MRVSTANALHTLGIRTPAVGLARVTRIRRLDANAGAAGEARGAAIHARLSQSWTFAAHAGRRSAVTAIGNAQQVALTIVRTVVAQATLGSFRVANARAAAECRAFEARCAAVVVARFSFLLERAANAGGAVVVLVVAKQVRFADPRRLSAVDVADTITAKPGVHGLDAAARARIAKQISNAVVVIDARAADFRQDAAGASFADAKGD